MAIIHQLKEHTPVNPEKTDPTAAIKNYLTVIKKEKYNTGIYNRLMILYRRQKEYEKEAALIQKAIEIFEAFYAKHQPRHSTAITKLSKSLAIATGLASKKGESFYDPEPIAEWRKRLTTLNKRFLKKTTGKKN